MSATSFDQQNLPTGDGHTLFVAQYGQPDAPAAVVLHGGPGSGTQPSVLEWFDLARQRVVLFDQRGAGQSQPHGEIINNDSTKLVADIEMIRERLGIERWMVVGGSWGATLALLYAAQHARRIRAMVLRGSFLASQRELHWFFQSLRAMVPHAWDQLTLGWQEEQKQQVLATLGKQLLHGSEQEAEDAATRWGAYEEAIMQAMSGKLALPTTPSKASARTVGKYRLQAHYLLSACFSTEADLIDAANALANTPTVIVHGSHDLVCPPENAARLAKLMPHARLHWVPRGGHTPADPLIAAALREAVLELHPSS
ncbi:MhpC Predicted hydrolases or acyltransferases (alpha/beta hydrolase superfamily) [Oxalobacteraceae bacterium]